MHAYAVAVRGAHAGPVLGLSCAVSKPLLVSCGADRTVRVWDYLVRVRVRVRVRLRVRVS